MDDLNNVVKDLMLMLNDIQTQITALRFAMEDQGLLSPDQKASAMKRSLEIWGPRKAALEKLGATEDTTLEKLLSSARGPIQ